MTGLILTWLVSATSLFLTSKIVPGFKITSFGSALISALVLGVITALLGPILLFLSIPFNILTLGLFTFVVNAILLRLAAGLLKGFDINGWIPALLGALVLALLNMVLNSLLY